MLIRILLFSLTFLSAAQAFGIVIRHDRDDARYRELGEKYRGPVVEMGVGGVGTLVGQRWIATAAHVTDAMTPYHDSLLIGARTVKIKAIYVHPSWNATSNDRNDLALVELGEAVTWINPVKLYDRPDELGKRIIFVGNGYTGTGLQEPIVNDRVWRGAENTVTQVTEGSIRFLFDTPPAGDDLEGISGPGDSGGPALLDLDGEIYLLGTSGSNSAPRGQGHCTYGSIESYGRVSTSIDWAREVMRSEVQPSSHWTPSSSSWPSGAMAAAAKKFLEVHNSGDPSAMASFFEKILSDSQRNAVSHEVRRDRARERFDALGPLEFLSTAQHANGRVLVLFRSKKTKARIVLGLTQEEGTDKVQRLTLSELPPG
jgi:hypothetical protein